MLVFDRTTAGDVGFSRMENAVVSRGRRDNLQGPTA